MNICPHNFPVVNCIYCDLHDDSVQERTCAEHGLPYLECGTCERAMRIQVDKRMSGENLSDSEHDIRTREIREWALSASRKETIQRFRKNE